MNVKLTINTCKDCPNLKTHRLYTCDSWEHVATWYCGLVDRPEPRTTTAMPIVENSSYIANVEYPREEPKKIPVWCPLKDNESK